MEGESCHIQRMSADRLDVHSSKPRTKQLSQGLHNGSLHGNILLHQGMKLFGRNHGRPDVSGRHDSCGAGSVVDQRNFSDHMAFAQFGDIFARNPLDLDSARKNDEKIAASFELTHHGFATRVVDLAGDCQNSIKLSIAQPMKKIACPQFFCPNHPCSVAD